MRSGPKIGAMPRATSTREAMLANLERKRHVGGEVGYLLSGCAPT